MSSDNPYTYDGTAAPPREPATPRELNYWVPDETVTLHNGQPIPKTMVFPYPPPVEIGRIVSADTYGLIKNFHWEPYAQLYLVTNLFGIMMLFTDRGGLLMFLYLNAGITLVCVFLIGISRILGLILQLADSLRGRVNVNPLISYVGEDGFAIWEKSILQRRVFCNIVPYATIDRLQAGWLFDELGNRILNTLDISDGPEDEFFRFRLQIERTWTSFFVRRWMEQFNTTHRGELPFSETQTLVFNEELLALQISNELIPLSKHEISTLRSIGSGGWLMYLREQECRFPLDQIPNPSAAMTILGKLCHVPFLRQEVSPVLDNVVSRQSNV